MSLALLCMDAGKIAVKISMLLCRLVIEMVNSCLEITWKLLSNL